MSEDQKVRMEMAFPHQLVDDHGNHRGTGLGLTKREYFAARAMQGMLSTITCLRWEDNVVAGVVESSVEYADKLIAELEKKKGTQS